MPPPSSTPKPVSASPPSWRNPTSARGTSEAPSSSATVQLPSSPSRSRVTSASEAARPSAFSEDVRAHMASETSASAGPPSAGASTSLPRKPAAAMRQSMSAVMAAPVSGVSVISPSPRPAAPQSLSRAVASQAA